MTRYGVNSKTRKAEIYSNREHAAEARNDDDGVYRDLANAVIERAVRDYGYDRKKIAQIDKKLADPNITEDRRTSLEDQRDIFVWDMEDIEKCFNTDWFQMLAGGVSAAWIGEKVMSTTAKERRGTGNYCRRVG